MFRNFRGQIVVSVYKKIRTIIKTTEYIVLLFRRNFREKALAIIGVFF